MFNPDEAKARLLNSILERSAHDFHFRQQLLTQPSTAIRNAFGVQIPDGYRIKFIERDANLDSLVVLPSMKLPDGELSEDDLESVAGGTDQPVWGDGTNG
jgi:hypothetical protein